MYSRVQKLFIAKDIARTSSLVVLPYHNGSGADNDNIASGEVVVLDKNMNVLTAGATVADSETIYIVEGLSTTQTYANEAGTSITARKLIVSDPINGRYMRNYSAKTYTAKVEKTATFGYINQTITAGDEYVLRIVYKDIKEHPGQYTHTYRWVVDAATATNDTLIAKIATLINTHEGARVTASVTNSGSNDYITLTAKAIPGCTTSLNDIDEFRMVDFEAFFYWIDQTASTYHGVGPFNQVTMSADTTYVGPIYPQGSWEVVRDEEKSHIQQQFGASNKIHFPVIKPDFRTVVDETYNQIVIEHDGMIQTPDNGYRKNTRLSTKIYLPVGAGQTTNILAALNPWMESAGFQSVAL